MWGFLIGRGPFLAITREPRFCQTCGFHQKIEHINTFRLNIIWTTSSWLVFLQKCKMSKTSFLGYFGPFLPNFGKMGVFPKNRASSLFFIYWPSTLCKKSEKTNGGKYENLRCGLTDWRSWIHKDSWRVLIMDQNKHEQRIKWHRRSADYQPKAIGRLINQPTLETLLVTYWGRRKPQLARCLQRLIRTMREEKTRHLTDTLG